MPLHRHAWQAHSQLTFTDTGPCIPASTTASLHCNLHGREIVHPAAGSEIPSPDTLGTPPVLLQPQPLMQKPLCECPFFRPRPSVAGAPGAGDSTLRSRQPPDHPRIRSPRMARLQRNHHHDQQRLLRPTLGSASRGRAQHFRMTTSHTTEAQQPLRRTTLIGSATRSLKQCRSHIEADSSSRCGQQEQLADSRRNPSIRCKRARSRKLHACRQKAPSPRAENAEAESKKPLKQGLFRNWRSERDSNPR